MSCAQVHPLTTRQSGRKGMLIELVIPPAGISLVTIVEGCRGEEGN